MLDNLPWERNEYGIWVAGGFISLIPVIIMVVGLCVRQFEFNMLVVLICCSSVMIGLAIWMFYFAYKLYKLPIK